MLDTTATVTAKGQVTIPAEIRRALGIRPHDRVRLEVEGGRLTLRREGANGKHFNGAAPRAPFDGSAQELIEAETAAFEQGVAEEVIAETMAERLKGSIKTKHRPLTGEELRAASEQAMADDVVARTR